MGAGIPSAVTLYVAVALQKPAAVLPVMGALGQAVKVGENFGIKVSYMGKDYYVCCSGCRTAFNDEPEKFIKDLQKRNGIVEIYDQLSSEKVLEFLENNAAVETVPAKA